MNSEAVVETDARYSVLPTSRHSSSTSRHSSSTSRHSSSTSQDFGLKKNSEVRIQERSRRRSASGQNQDALYEALARTQTRLPPTLLVGDSDPPLGKNSLLLAVAGRLAHSDS